MSTQAKSHRRLSVVVIARDEEEVLGDTLASIAPIAEEIIVVDTGSSDGTRDVAREHGARVIDEPWDDDFSKARNRGLREATGDWILWLDASERLAADCVEPLRSFIQNDVEPKKAYLLMIEVPPEAPGASAEQVGRIRLMPNVSDIEFTGRIRETPRSSLEQKGISLEVTPLKILRTAREHDPEVKRRKAQRDLRLIELEMNASGRRPDLLVALGEIHAAIDEQAKAAELFRAAVAASPNGSTDQLQAYYGLLTTFTDSAEDREAQLAACVRSLGIFPFDAQLLCAMGGYLQSQGRPDLARRSYEGAYQVGQVNPEIWHLADVGELSALCLVINYQLEGQEDQAKQVLEDSLKRFPESNRLRRHQLEVQVRDGNVKAALAALDRLPEPPVEVEALRTAIRGACLAAQQNWISALAYLQTAYSAGCRDPICLRWLAAALMASGNHEEAEAILRDWQSRDPQNPEIATYLEALHETPALDDSVEPLSLPQHVTPRDSTTAAATEESGSDAPPAETERELRHLRIDSAKHPTDAKVHFHLGQAYHQFGDVEAAEAVWRDYLSRCPGSPSVVRALCELCLRGGRRADALELFSTAQMPAEEDPFVNFMAGVARAEEGEWSDALRQLQTSHESGYDDPLVLERLAECLDQLGRAEEAEPLLRELLIREPSHRRGRDLLLRLLRQSGRSREAKMLLERVQLAQPTSGHHLSPRPSSRAVGARDDA